MLSDAGFKIKTQGCRSGTNKSRLEKQGVSVFAVRRPLFQDPVVILKFLSRRGYGVLLQNGDVDYFPDIVVRGETRSEGSKSVESFRSGFSQRGTVD